MGFISDYSAGGHITSAVLMACKPTIADVGTGKPNFIIWTGPNPLGHNSGFKHISLASSPNSYNFQEAGNQFRRKHGTVTILCAETTPDRITWTDSIYPSALNYPVTGVHVPTATPEGPFKALFTRIVTGGKVHRIIGKNQQIRPVYHNDHNLRHPIYDPSVRRKSTL